MGEPAEHRRRDLGLLGEAHAVDHYRRAGYTVVARNWRCGLGELDLVLSRNGLLVVCEVKTRRGGASAFGGPFDAVAWRKQRKLRALAEAFIQESRWRGDAVRFDVASVTVSSAGVASVFVFEAAF
jgi:putative endonuclease